MKRGERKARVFSKLTAMMLVMVMILVCFPGFSNVANAAGSSATVHTSGANLNVRSGPSTDYQIIAKLKNGTTVKVHGSSGSWYKVEYTVGKTGYVSGQYLKFSGSSSSSSGSYPVVARVTNGGVPLKLRQKATTSSAILAEIPRGSKIKITGKYNSEWYTAVYSGKSGYVYSSYIIMPNSGNGSSSSNTGSTGSNSSSSSKYTYSKISLNVPLYSQKDSRWADLKLGNTSYTIRQCGCVVCGLAQIESYLQGKQITPDIMLKKLSFDSEGRLYWPNGYVSDNSSNYLSGIYKQLKKGNPVLIGGFTPSNKQHWVVVTGYKTNSNSLSASNFVVNDCSDRYSTLAAYLKNYSDFYKIVYKK